MRPTMHSLIPLSLVLAMLGDPAVAVAQAPNPFAETARLTASAPWPTGEPLSAVAVDGDTVVVGAPRRMRNKGIVYVFEKPGASWANATEVARLTASDGDTDHRFGADVAISGDVIVVGSSGEGEDRGAAYVFVKPAGGWVDATETAKLTTAARNVALFGISVAIDGDTIAAGGPNVLPGAVYVFVKPAGGWVSATETAKLTAAAPVTGRGIGSSVDVDGDAVVAGPFSTSVGVVYLWEKPGTGWVNTTEAAVLTAASPGANDEFGTAVAIDQGIVAVGANRADTVGTFDVGAVYIFEEPPSGWVDATETAKLVASDGLLGDRLGFSVAIDGQSVVAGATGVSRQVGLCQPALGAAYLFAEPATGWANGTEDGVFTDALFGSGTSFGTDVTIDGDTVVVTDPSVANANGVQNGVGFVFDAPYVSQGAPPGVPVLTSLFPTSVQTRDLPAAITVTGAELEMCVGSTVTVGEMTLAIVSSTPTAVTFSLPAGLVIGSYDVIVHSVGPGPSNALSVDVVGNHPSVLIGPGLHPTATTQTYTTWTDAGWNALYLLSGVLGTTALPGIVEFEIGGGLFGNLVGVITQQADNIGRIDLPVTLPPGLPTPFTLYWECLTYDPNVPLGLQAPLETSNAVTVLTFF